MKKVHININEGVGDLTFTMTRNDVELTLGQAEVVDDFIYEEPVYYYNELGLAVIFELQETEFVISSFELEKDNYILWGSALFKKSYNEVIDFFKSLGISSYQEDSYDDTKYIYYDNLSIIFEKDIVTTIALSNPKLE